MSHDQDDEVESGGFGPSAVNRDEESLESLSDSIHQLRYTIDEMCHQLMHLIRSQGELLDAIHENPDDEDFAEAFWGNTEVVKKKKATIQGLLAKIWNRDPVYFRKVDKLLSELAPDTPPNEIETDNVDRTDDSLDSQPLNSAISQHSTINDGAPNAVPFGAIGAEENNSNVEQEGVYL